MQVKKLLLNICVTANNKKNILKQCVGILSCLENVNKENKGPSHPGQTDIKGCNVDFLQVVGCVCLSILNQMKPQFLPLTFPA